MTNSENDEPKNQMSDKNEESGSYENKPYRLFYRTLKRQIFYSNGFSIAGINNRIDFFLSPY